jgi:hypothetical protein
MMLWLAANWRIAFVLSALALTIGGVAYVQHLQSAAQHAKASEKAALVQTKVETAAVQAVDHYVEHTVILREKAERAVDAVQAAPGADAPLPPELRSVWLAGLRDLSPSPDHPNPGQPALAVPVPAP